MHNKSISNQQFLLDCYVANARYSLDFIKSNDKLLNAGAKQVIEERGRRMLLWGIMRAFKIDKVRFFINNLRENNLYPFEWMRRPEYQMKKIKLFYHISQYENLVVFLSKLFKIYTKFNPKALNFDNL